MFKSLLALLGFVIFAPFTTGINCGDWITQSVTLDHDFVCNSHEGLVINGQNITLDCAGHSITTTYYGSGAVVYVYASTNVTVKNCVLMGTAMGIAIDAWNPTASDPFDYPGYNRIINNTITNVVYGIHLTGARNNTIANNTILGPTEGLWISHAGNLNITGNHIEASAFPLDLGASDSIFLSGNQIIGYRTGTNEIGAVGNLSIINNTFSNSNEGLFLANAPKARIMNNFFIYDSGTGTGVDLGLGCDGSVVFNNVIWSNYSGVWGIEIGLNSYCNVSNNNMTGVVRGIETGGMNSTIEHNNFWVSTTKAGSDYALNFWKNNYYQRYDAPEEGCNDSNSDLICDAPYSIYPSGNYDNTPYISPNAWLLPRSPPGGSPIFIKSKYTLINQNSY